MTKEFQKVGLIGRRSSDESIESLNSLYKLLISLGIEIVLEEDTAKFLHKNQGQISSREQFGKSCDLVIVVGGDGSLLNAAHVIVDQNTPVLGINRGRLGFLTDIYPPDLTQQVKEVLEGNYTLERRFLLNAEIRHKGEVIHRDIALNDVVLMPGEFSHMLEYKIFINQQLLCAQRADGQIIATPTGSTAYALSGGGPILHPKLNAIVLVPMFPQALSSRPIVVDSNSEIDIVMVPKFQTSPQISCDGQQRISIASGDTLHVYRKKEELLLLHPLSYNYYKTLRTKLWWEKKIS